MSAAHHAGEQPTYKGFPIVSVEEAARAGGDVFVIDRAALSGFLIEPKWERPLDYRTAAIQERLYRLYLGLDFGRSEPEWRMLQRRADDALHRAIGSRDPLGRRWWRDLRDAIRFGFKASYVRAARPDAQVPTAAMSFGRITGLT
jgi:hypothetical protein